MTPRILENVPAWLVDWSLMSMMPPRDPNDDEEEEDEDAEPDDDPAVVREPDE